MLNKYYFPHGGKLTGRQEVEGGDSWSIRPLRVLGAREGGEVLYGPEETQNNGKADLSPILENTESLPNLEGVDFRGVPHHSREPNSSETNPYNYGQ